MTRGARAVALALLLVLSSVASAGAATALDAPDDAAPAVSGGSVADVAGISAANAGSSAAGSDAANNGYDPNAAGPAADASARWILEVAETVREGDVVAENGTVYVAGYSGVRAVDNVTGELLWNTTAFEATGLAVAGDTVYVTGEPSYGESIVVALDASDGSERWNDTRENVEFRTPRVANGTLFVDYESRVRAYDAGTGDYLWSSDSRFSWEGEAGGIAVAADTVYLPVRFDDGPFTGLVAVNVSDGTERWRFEVDGELAMTPTVANGTVYVGKGDEGRADDPDPRLYALDPADGSIEWAYDSYAVPHGVTVADGTVYLASGNSIRALSEATGVESWSFDAGGNDYPRTNPPAVADGVVYVTNDRGTVHALDAGSGARRWSYRTGGRAETPVVSGDAVYVRARYDADTNQDWEGSRVYALEENPFSFSGLSPSAATVAPGEAVTVDVTVRNDDDEARAFNVSLIDDRPHVGGETSKGNLSGTLDPGDSTTLTFSTSFNVTGDHDLSIRRELDPESDTDPVAVTVEHASPNADWPNVGFDVAGSDANPAGVGATERLQEVWNHTGDYDYDPVVANGTTYIVDKDGGANRNDLVAFDEVTGEERWRYNTSVDDRRITGSPAATDDLVFLTTFPFSYSGDDVGSNATIYALHASNGTVAWSTKLEIDEGYAAAGDNAPVVADGTVYVAGNLAEDETSSNTYYDARVYGLDAATGTIGWTYSFGSDDENERASGFAVGNDHAFVLIDNDHDSTRTTDSYELHAVDLTTESLAWRKTGVSLDVTPLVADGHVYVANRTTADDGVSAFHVADGTEAWRLDEPLGGGYDADVRHLAFHDGHLYAVRGYYASSNQYDTLYKVDPATGAVRWNGSLGYAASMSIVDGLVYVGSSGYGYGAGYTDLYDAATGEHLGDSHVGAMLAVANGTVYTYYDPAGGTHRYIALRPGARIVLSDMQVAPGPVGFGENVTVTATATNVGTSARGFRTDLDVSASTGDYYSYNGTIQNDQGTLAPGESTTVTYVVKFYERGEFAVSIDPHYHGYYGGSPAQHVLDQYLYDEAGNVTISVGDAHDGTTVALPSRTMPATGDSWPKRGFDANNTGHHGDATGPTAVGQDVAAWNNTESVYGWTTAPTVADGTVYVGDGDGLHALDAADGSIEWTYGSAGELTSAPTYAGGFVYFGNARRLYAVNATTGHMLWSFAGGGVDGAPTVVDGVVYFGTSDDRVYALNASTRDVLWSFAADGAVYTSPAVANGTVYASSYADTVYALNATTGAEEWSAALPGGYDTTSPVVNGSAVYVGNSDHLYAFDAGDGAPLWDVPADLGGDEADFPTKPAIANGTVYFGDDDAGSLRAVDAATGADEWSYRLCSPVDGAPAVVDGVVYFGANDGVVYALDAATGDDVWNFRAVDGDPSYPVVYAPAVADGVAYVSTDGGNYPSLLALTGGTSNTTADPFSVSGLAVNRTDVSAGQAIAVSATVSNDGASTCDYTAELAIDDTAVDTATVSVSDGDTATATFEHVFDSAGTYDVSIDGLAPMQVNVSGPEPEVDVSPTSYDYGDQDVGASHTDWQSKYFRVDNLGQADLDWTSATLTGPDAGSFSIASGYDSGAIVAPDDNDWILVFFTPEDAGTQTATLEVATNDSDESVFEVALTGTGVAEAPNASVAPTSHDFGDVPVGATATYNVTVTNDGGGTLTFDGVDRSGSAAFEITAGSESATLASGESHEFTVSFTPTIEDSVGANLDVLTDDPDAPSIGVYVSGSGTTAPAPEIDVSSTAHDFGNVSVGDTATASFVVANTGTATLSVTDARLTGPDAGEFSLSTATPFAVAPGDTATIDVEFAPTSVGSKSVALEIDSDDADEGTVPVALTGTGVDAEPPTVEIVDVTGAHTAGSTVYANGTVRVNVTADGTPGAPAAVRVVLNATRSNYRVVEAATDDGANWTAEVDLANVVDDGRYRVEAVAVDAAGNANATTAAETVIVDRTAPTLAATASREDAATGRVNLTADEALRGGSLSVAVERPGDSTVAVPMSDAGDRWTGTFPLGSSGGQYNVSAAALDLAGNAGTAEARATIENRSTDANNTITMKLEPSELFVTFTTDEPVNDTFVTVTESNAPLAPLVRGQAGVNFLNARLDRQLAENLSYAIIGIPVDPSLLPPGAATDDVTIRHFNETDRAWEDVPTTVERVTLADGTEGDYWVANVTHFSTYGAVATDADAPTLIGSTPVDGHEFASGTTAATLRVEFTDAMSGVNASEVVVRYDGVDVTGRAATQVTSGHVAFRATGLANGSSHALAVTVVDEAGHDATFRRSFSVAPWSPAPSTDDGNDDSGDDGDTPGGPGGSIPGPSVPPTTVTTTAATATGTPTATGTTEPAGTSTSAAETAAPTVARTPTTEGPTASPATTESSGQPGFGPLAAILALLAAVLLGSRGRRGSGRVVGGDGPDTRT